MNGNILNIVRIFFGLVRKCLMPEKYIGVKKTMNAGFVGDICAIVRDKRVRCTLRMIVKERIEAELAIHGSMMLRAGCWNI